MGKLVKQMYTTSTGERKTNCYMVTIPKKVVELSRIEENDEIVAYKYLGGILITKKWHCTCNECGCEWDSGEPYGITSACPRCGVGDISYEINGED